jgi:hypothetical protein
MSSQFLYRRRQFMSLIGGAVVAWPVIGRSDHFATT